MWLNIRSKQRGWLELDLLLGEFALYNLPDYNDSQLDLWEEVTRTQIYNIQIVLKFVCGQILDAENPDLYKYLTFQLQPPDSLQVCLAFALQTGYCADNMSGSKTVCIENCRNGFEPRVWYHSVDYPQ